MVDATSGEGLFQVSVPLQWCPCVTVASGQFSTKRHLRQAVVLQPGDASCPAQLYLEEQGLDADGLRCGGSAGGAGGHA